MQHPLTINGNLICCWVCGCLIYCALPLAVFLFIVLECVGVMWLPHLIQFPLFKELLWVFSYGLLYLRAGVPTTLMATALIQLDFYAARYDVVFRYIICDWMWGQPRYCCNECVIAMQYTDLDVAWGYLVYYLCDVQFVIKTTTVCMFFGVHEFMFFVCL